MLPYPTTVLIIGAGPAGMALGRELSIRAIPYLILDKESTVGSTFAKMTESTTFGPWMNNTLPGSPVPWGRRLSRTTRAAYAKYLQDYAVDHQLRVLCNVKVSGVCDHQQGFLVRTEQGDSFSSEYLVNATGCFSKPRLPEYLGISTLSIPSLHSSAYRCPETIVSLTGEKSAKVLIVGCRLSAGEILEQLHNAGHEVHLSHRSRIDTSPSPLEESLLSPLTYLWEELSLRLGWPRPANLERRLRRGRQWSLLTSCQVGSHPDIARIRGDRVLFVDRVQEQFDAILFATGYLPALDHLAPLVKQTPPWLGELESVEIPNLFFLGLSGSRSFRSEFLRGIREDAVHLGGLLAARMAPAHLRGLPSRRQTGKPLRKGRRQERAALRMVRSPSGDDD